MKNCSHGPKKTVFLVIMPIKDTNKKTRKSAIKD